MQQKEIKQPLLGAIAPIVDLIHTGGGSNPSGVGGAVRKDVSGETAEVQLVSPPLMDCRMTCQEQTVASQRVVDLLARRPLPVNTLGPIG